MSLITQKDQFSWTFIHTARLVDLCSDTTANANTTKTLCRLVRKNKSVLYIVMGEKFIVLVIISKESYGCSSVTEIDCFAVY